MIAFAAIVGAALWQGCQKSQPPGRPSLIVVSGDTQGWITPCGCTANQSGGLLRRATYLNQLRLTADVLYFDVGGAPAGTSPFQIEKFKAILAGENAMGIGAHNIGAAEAALGADALQKLVKASNVPLLSANVHFPDGSPIAPPLHIFNCQGKRLAVIGVMSQRFANPAVTVDDPRTAILSTLAAHKGEFDWVMVLAYLPEEELRQLAAALPEADAIVGGPTVQSIAPQMAGPVLLAAATNKGKFIIKLRPPTDAAPTWSGDVVELGPTFADDPAQLANLQTYLALLHDRDFTAAESGFAPYIPAGAPPDYRLAGSSSCLSCHADSGAIWEHSLHAFAGKILEPRHFEADPDCLRCHTTGYGLPGGFISPRKTPQLYGVGCENCHGPSQAHVNDPAIHTQYQAFDQCIRCHDEENSPAFKRDTYWHRIQHGKPSTQPSRAEATR